MNPARFTLKYRAVVVILVIVALVWGIINFQTTPRSEEPPFTSRISTVSTYWPARNAERVETLVTEPLENAIDAIDGVDKVRSISSTDLSVIYVEADRGLKGPSVHNLWDMVRAEIGKVKPSLPDGAEEPRVDTDFADTAALVFAVYQRRDGDEFSDQPTYSPRQLESMAETIKDEIELVEGVAEARLSAVRREVIYLEAEAGNWSRLGLGVDDLRALLQKRNIVAPAGIIETPEARYGVKPLGEFDMVEDISNMVVGRDANGLPVYLKDLGVQVRRDYRAPPEGMARIRDPGLPASAPCVVVSCTMKKGGIVTDLTRRVRKRVEFLRAERLPPDLVVRPVSDQGRVVEQRVNGFALTLAEAVAVVILVAFVLVGLRIGLVMTVTIPLVIISSFGIVRFFGVQIEQISAVSFIIALGLLVDNTIEVCENIHRLLMEGYDRFTATINGVKQLVLPVLMATLTTVFAFLPMLTIPGDTGEFLYSLPVVVSTTLIVSWLVAMTVTALLAYVFLAKSSKPPPISRLWQRMRGADQVAQGVGAAGKKLYGPYAAVNGVLLRHKYLVIAVTLVAFAGAVLLVVTGAVGTQFFPAGRRTQFVVDVYLPEGSSLARTNAMTRRVERIILDQSRAGGSGKERLKELVAFVGESGPRIHVSVEPEPYAPNFARILVNTTSPRYTEKFAWEIRREAAQLPGCRIVPRMFVLGPPVESPIAIRIMGENPLVLSRYADQIKAGLRDTGQAWDIHDSWGHSIKQLVVRPYEDVAKTAGVSRADLARTINAFFAGAYLTTYREGDHQIPVVLRLPPEQWRDVSMVEDIHIEGAHGKVPVQTVADVDFRPVPARIQHHRKVRCLEVKARPRGDLLANSVLRRISSDLADIREDMPPGYRLEIGGEQEETLRSQKDIAFSFMIALLLIIVCLVIQYNSLVKPLVILFTLPMAAIGAFPGLLITGQPLGFMAMLGLLSLAGVVLNDAIVYTTFVEDLIEQKLADGNGDSADRKERSRGGLNQAALHYCLIRAGQMRMLPISLTTLTTIGGLLPVAIFGGPLWRPLAVVVIFGLIAGTLLTLFVLPAVYAILVEKNKFKG